MKYIFLIAISLSIIASCKPQSKEELNPAAFSVKITRKGSVIKVKPEKLEYYKSLHANPWESVDSKLKESNIRNYSIYYRDGYLFSYLEYTGQNWEEDMTKLAADSAIQAWWKLTDPCQEPIESAIEGEWWADL